MSQIQWGRIIRNCGDSSIFGKDDMPEWIAATGTVGGGVEIGVGDGGLGCEEEVGGEVVARARGEKPSHGWHRGCGEGLRGASIAGEAAEDSSELRWMRRLPSSGAKGWMESMEMELLPWVRGETWGGQVVVMAEGTAGPSTTLGMTNLFISLIAHAWDDNFF